MIEAALEIHWQRVRRHSLRDWGRESALECVRSPLNSLVICPKVSGWRGDEYPGGLLITGHTLITLQERGPGG